MTSILGHDELSRSLTEFDSKLKELGKEASKYDSGNSGALP